MDTKHYFDSFEARTLNITSIVSRPVRTVRICKAMFERKWWGAISIADAASLQIAWSNMQKPQIVNKTHDPWTLAPGPWTLQIVLENNMQGF